jgi:nudix-type nucleoside diphosphatase (YffH/AdpP family)
MARVRLDGSIWTETLVERVAGAAVKPEATARTLVGPAADRAIFFAEVAGLAQDRAGDDVVLRADGTIGAKVFECAADEIMGYFGRFPAQELGPRRQMILSRAAAQVAAGQAPAPADLRNATRGEAVDTLFRHTPHEGFFLTRSYHLRHPQFAGGMSEAVTREVFVATDAAIVLPYDAQRDRILLVEQFRMGPFGRGDPLPWVLEPVAGRVDAGETAEEAAKRECREEADLELTQLLLATSHYCSPGCSTEMFHCYIGLCDLPQPGETHGGLDSEHEDLRRHVISFDDAMAMTRTGEVNIGPLFLLLLWLERERPRLRASA